MASFVSAAVSVGHNSRSSFKSGVLKKWGLVSLLLVLASSPFSLSYAEVLTGAEDKTVENPVSSAIVQDPLEPNAAASQAELQRAEAQTSSAVPATPFYDKSTTQSPAPATGSRVGSVGHLLNTVIGLVLIIALIFGLSFFLKRFGTGNFAGNSQLKVLSSMPLGTRERIVLIDAAGQQLLLGITPTNIHTLHVFAEPVVMNNDSAMPTDFGKTLMNLLQSKKMSRAVGDNNSGDHSRNNDNNSPVV